MPPEPRNPRYESLDMWRGIACLLIVVFHSLGGLIITESLIDRVRNEGGTPAEWVLVVLSRCWVGVAIFFVISGYCIAAAADSARKYPHPGRTFFQRRIRRIYPPLWVYLLLFVVLIELLPATAIPPATEHHGPPLPEPSAIAPAQWFGMVTLTEEWRPYLGGPAKGYVSGQLWSLCYEEQFYLVMGLAIVLSRSRLFTTLGVLTLLIFLNVLDLNAVLGRHLGLDLNSLQVRLPGLFVNGLWLSFAAGIAVYYRANYATPIFKRCLDGFLLVGLVMTLRQVKSFWDFQANLTGYLLTGFITACILSALHRYDAEISAARVTRPLQSAGRMCYSLYLVHAPVAILIQWNLFRLGICSPTAGLLITLPAAMTASLLLSRVFHVYVEARFLNPPQRARVPGSAWHAGKS